MVTIESPKGYIVFFLGDNDKAVPMKYILANHQENVYKCLERMYALQTVIIKELPMWYTKTMQMKGIFFIPIDGFE